MLVIAMTACGEPERLAGLRAMEEAGLAFPESTRLATGGYDEELTMDGPQPAATWTIYGTTAPAEEVIAFFEEEADLRGWDGGLGIRSTSEVEAYSWRREDSAWRLGILDVEEWHQRIDGSDRYPTMYEVRVSQRRDAMDES
jgi:hypothetical protein